MGPSLALEFAFFCCSIADFALFIWDHVITFGEEVSKIWTKKISGGSVLYLLLRYGTAVEKISIMLLASWYMNPHGQVLSGFVGLGLSAYKQITVRIAGLVADLLSETMTQKGDLSIAVAPGVPPGIRTFTRLGLALVAAPHSTPPPYPHDAHASLIVADAMADLIPTRWLNAIIGRHRRRRLGYRSSHEEALKGETALVPQVRRRRRDAHHHLRLSNHLAPLRLQLLHLQQEGRREGEGQAVRETRYQVAALKPHVVRLHDNAIEHIVSDRQIRWGIVLSLIESKLKEIVHPIIRRPPLHGRRPLLRYHRARNPRWDLRLHLCAPDDAEHDRHHDRKGDGNVRKRRTWFGKREDEVTARTSIDTTSSVGEEIAVLASASATTSLLTKNPTQPRIANLAAAPSPRPRFLPRPPPQHPRKTRSAPCSPQAPAHLSAAPNRKEKSPAQPPPPPPPSPPVPLRAPPPPEPVPRRLQPPPPPQPRPSSSARFRSFRSLRPATSADTSSNASSSSKDKDKDKDKDKRPRTLDVPRDPQVPRGSYGAAVEKQPAFKEATRKWGGGVNWARDLRKRIRMRIKIRDKDGRDKDGKDGEGGSDDKGNEGVDKGGTDRKRREGDWEGESWGGGMRAVE
ncbi:hypothetical protein M422DRAFT_779202 [Sphaerobolus stellatus SS14]|uniref:DUF6533 domain-containing protein n=1 Tax=Sphaerobolus stellatus (strain SS14) TaxID=990650 RepID=A0A0C9W0K1_SPHS4|nr:hypothetical protein M422DRAFT_779202 [Sphaerobolus stellatus SS14]